MPAQLKIQWKPIYQFESQSVSIVSAKSKRDIWLNLNSSQLLHYLNDSLIYLELPENNITRHLRDVSYHRIDDNQFFCSLVDKDYHTHFFRYCDSAWQRLPATASVPVRNFLQLTPEKSLVFGDWGSLYYFTDNQIYSIVNPMENHITSAATMDGKTIWFGVRNEGIYKWDGKQFIKYDVIGRHQEIIYMLAVSKDQVFAYTSDGKIFQKNNTKFTASDSMQFAQNWYRYKGNNPEYLISYNAMKYGKIFLRNAAGWHEIFVSGNSSINGAAVLPDSTILLTAKGGQLISGKPGKSFFFNEIASNHYLGGSLFDNSEAAAIFDFNKDGLLDIFVLNFGEEQYNRLLLNTELGKFIDKTEASGLITTNHAEAFSYDDINRDGQIDLVFLNNNLSIDFFMSHFHLLNYERWQRFNVGDVSNIKGFDLVDFNNDLDPDLVYSSYFSSGQKMGGVFVIHNKWPGHLTKPDTTVIKKSRGWVVETVFSDIDQDNDLDILVGNRWINNRILIQDDRAYTPFSDSLIIRPDSVVHSSYNISPFDFDNDGDLDIISLRYNKPGFTLFENINGRFLDITPTLFKEILVYPPSLLFLTIADYDNNGFQDIFSASANDRNYLFLNQSGEGFKEVAQEVGIAFPCVKMAVCGDMDNDGDIDILGLSHGVNQYWENRTDNLNFVTIIPQPVKSPASAKMTKIWLYDDTGLVGFREIGSANPGPGSYNAPIAHFGVSQQAEYRAEILFQSGKRKTITQITPGSRILVPEVSPFAAFFIRLPAIIMVVLQHMEFYFYILFFLIDMVLLLWGLKTGAHYFQWKQKPIVVILAFNISTFWIFANLMSHVPSVWKYIVPLFVALMGIIIPLVTGIHFFSREKAKDINQARIELLKSLLVFSHGEWTLSNMNSIQILCENFPGFENINDRYKTQFTSRIKTFETMVLPNLKKLTDLCELACHNTEMPLLLNESVEEVNKNIKLISTDLHTADSAKCKRMARSVGLLKQRINELKNLVYTHFSCDLQQVVTNVTDELNEMAAENSVTIVRQKKGNKSLIGLIQGYELGDIIDNCIRNSIVALQLIENNRQITVDIYAFQPKVRIDITDNGPGIPDDILEKIFQSGFTTYGGTGRGLFHAREILAGYGGSIFVAENQPGNTQISIELQEGRQA